jgi:gamma-glutamyl-gamma-aminobutyrate hydrolase PuuD
MKKIKIFEVSKYCKGEYSTWIENKILVESIDQADLVFFKGGDDVHPSFYFEPPHYSASHNLYRDLYEQQIYKSAVNAGKKIIGVCRGSQFLSVMQGCKLFQDIRGHLGSHELLTEDTNEKLLVTSTHHQAVPLQEAIKNPDFQLFAKSNAVVTYQNNEYLENGTYPIVEMGMFGKDILIIQSHPEMVCSSFENKVVYKGYETYIEYCRSLFKKLMEQ